MRREQELKNFAPSVQRPTIIETSSRSIPLDTGFGARGMLMRLMTPPGTQGNLR